MSVQKTDLIDLITWAENNKYNIQNREEIEEVISQIVVCDEKLKYSNDIVIDMIIGFIKDYTWKNEISDFLESIMVEDVWTNYAARSFENNNGKNCVEVNKVFLEIIQNVASVAGLYFVNMLYPDIKDKKKDLYVYYITGLVEAIDLKDKAQNNWKYWRAIELMRQIDEEGELHFTDLVVYFERGIYEMALAFIVGHEIGHHFLGHFKRNDSFVSIEHHRVFSEENDLCEDWKKEFFADAFGVDFSIRYMLANIVRDNPFDFIDYRVYKSIDYRILGIPVAAFASICFNSKCESDTGTHPSMLRRLDKIWEFLEENNVQKSIIDIVKKEYEYTTKTFEDARYLLRRTEYPDTSR